MGFITNAATHRIALTQLATTDSIIYIGGKCKGCYHQKGFGWGILFTARIETSKRSKTIPVSLQVIGHTAPTNKGFTNLCQISDAIVRNALCQ